MVYIRVTSNDNRSVESAIQQLKECGLKVSGKIIKGQVYLVGSKK